MITTHQKEQLSRRLKEYKKRYLRKQYAELDESATRLMINSLLTDVLGYIELEDIKTEYRIKGAYADYIIQLNRKKHLIIEVKAIQLDLSGKHLRQSVNYAANEGIDWILLTNGRQIELYRVIFNKPIATKQIFSVNLNEDSEFKEAVEFLSYLTKKSLLKEKLNDFWKRFEALEPNNLSKNFYAIEVVRFLRKILKQKTGFIFSDEDILDSIHQIIATKIELPKPKVPLNVVKQQKRRQQNAPEHIDEDGRD